jgi:E3 ubiquitin-protein ligase XBAT32/33
MIDSPWRALCRYVNRAATGGVTALHLAALHGHVDCVHLLIDEHAALGAQTVPVAAAPMAAIGAGSTPLHYAASGGEVKCCQILVSRGADRMAANCNGWLAVDVARMWNCNWLEHVLSPKSHLPVPKFPPSAYLSLPLPSLLAIAADHAVASPPFIPATDNDDNIDDACSVCLERSCNVAAEGTIRMLNSCLFAVMSRHALTRTKKPVDELMIVRTRCAVCGHELCLKCALDLCTVMKAYEVPGLAGTVPCPLCRSGIASFRKAVTASSPDDNDDILDSSLPCACARCQNCHAGGREEEKSPVSSCRYSSGRQSYTGGDGMDSEATALALYCAPFAAPAAILS